MNRAIHNGLQNVANAQCVSGTNIDTVVIVRVVSDTAYMLKVKPSENPSRNVVVVDFVDDEFSLRVASSFTSPTPNGFEVAYRELKTDDRREAFIRLITDLPTLLDKLAAELMLEVSMFCSLCEIATNPR